MRRVNEVIREVLGAAIATDLKDPRIGFVTVTAVETAPDLRSARVFVSVLGNAQERGCDPGVCAPHGFLQQKIASEVRMKRTPTLTFHYDDSIEQGMRVEASGAVNADRRRVRSSRSPSSCARETASCSPPTRRPTGTPRLLLAMHRILEALGKDSVMFLAAKEFRCRSDTASSPGGGLPRTQRFRRSRPSSSIAATSTGCQSSS
jgi:ribosome-binding factor A